MTSDENYIKLQNVHTIASSSSLIHVHVSELYILARSRAVLSACKQWHVMKQL